MKQVLFSKRISRGLFLILLGLGFCFSDLYAQCTGPSGDCDGDGIADSTDLDNDNDGILNTSECYENLVSFGSIAGAGQLSANGQSATFTQNIPGLDLSSDFTLTHQSSGSAVGTIITTLNNGRVLRFLDQAPANSSNNWANPISFVSPSLFRLTAENAVVLSEISDVDQIILTPTNPQCSNFQWIVNSSSNVNIVFFGPNNTYIQVIGVAGGNGEFDIVPSCPVGGFTIIHTTVTANQPLGNAFNLEMYMCQDTDGDGIEDSRDTDSDNDGCPDALEGNGSFMVSDVTNGRLNGAVSAGGVPAIAGTGQVSLTATNANLQSQVCTCDPGFPGFADADGDGVGNICDLDNDNDGIQDTLEGCYTVNVENFENAPNTVHSGYDQFAAAFPTGSSQLTNFAGTAGYFNNATINMKSNTYPAPPVTPYPDYKGGKPEIPAAEGVAYSGFHSSGYYGQEVVRIQLNAGEELTMGETYSLSFLAYQLSLGTIDPTLPYTSPPPGTFNSPGYFSFVGIPVGATGTSAPPAPTNDVYDWLAANTSWDLLGTSQLIDNTTSWEKYVVTFTAAENYDRILIFPTNVPVHDSTGEGAGADAFLAIDDIKYPVSKDSDSDGVADCMDMDSDNDGCPDALEGGASFVYADLDTSQSLQGTVSSTGIPVVADTGQAVGTSIDPSVKDAQGACDAPVALNDSLTVTGGTPTNGTVVDNDTCSVNIDCTYDDVSPPTHGILVFNPDGTYTYTPTPGYTGIDSFTYTICDAAGLCDTATVVITISIPLPVDLAYFKVSASSGCSAMLRWQSLQEINFHQYVVEWSADGRRYIPVGAVAGSGSGSVYSFLYNNAVEGGHYFRLKMTDRDQDYKYSAVRTVHIQCDNRNSAQVYPVVTNGLVTVSGVPSGAAMRLSDINGRRLMERRAEGSVVRFDLSRYAPGMYFLLISSEGGIQSYKLIRK